MSSRLLSRLLGVSFVSAIVAVLVWHTSWADKPKPEKPTPGVDGGERLTTATLGGEERYLTHVSTDKPIYRVGESIYMRGVILHHASRKPLPSDTEVTALVEIQGPKGDTTASGYVSSKHSVLGYSWIVPDGQAGGEYTIRVTYPGNGYSPAERKFDIRNYRAPRLKSQIDFLRDGYGPGDRVVATLDVERAEGGVPAGAQVSVIARVDGQVAFQGRAEVDAEGHCQARFKLPDEIKRGEGTLAMIVEDGGVVETATKTIPILLQTVDLTMYPEGGELVAGLPNRVYFEAFTPAKKPADLAGLIVDPDGEVVARFRSHHEGRGRFEFTPAGSKQYTLQITEPSGIKTVFPLPQVVGKGAVIQATRNVYAAGQPVKLRVGTTEEQTFEVTISKREKEIAKKAVKAKGLTQISLDLPKTADGVLVATIWDATGRPLAERLIFREPSQGIRVQISADAPQYVPGGKARLTVKTTDAEGKPISALVGVSVTDDSVLEMLERRDQPPRLPVMVLLENEVNELADSQIYLDPDNPDAPRAVDLLLGTQGWRRFALVRAADIVKEHGDNARRALALRMNSSRHLIEVLRSEAEGPIFLGAVQELDGAGILVPQAAERIIDEAKNEAEPQGEADDSVAAAEQPAPPAKKPVVDPQPKGQIAAARAPEGKRESRAQGKLRAALDDAFDGRRRNAFLAGKDLSIEVRNDFVPVRVYAHQVRSDRKPGSRVDFTETLFWHTGILTDASSGTASVEFGMSDAVTGFRVFADAFSSEGGLGTSSDVIESVKPFYVEPKLPLEVTAGDRILAPVGLVNATSDRLAGGEIAVTAHPELTIETPGGKVELNPQARERMLIALDVGQHNGPAEFSLSASAGAFADNVTRHITIRPQGFPVEEGFGGIIGPGSTVTHEVEIPAQVVAGSLAGRIVVYPTPLANMTEALERLIREPYGCFEQTSSTTYPLVMAQQYFMSHQGVDPSLVERSSKILDKGYQRLLGFECKSGGFEWFGQDPGHEALSAYGLLEFTDMSQVRHVDPKMLERTRQWLLDQRDGKGGFKRNRRALHTWIAEPECSNAYITWALLEAGLRDELKKEIAWVRDAGERSHNTYAIALSANVLGLADDVEGANHLLDKLAGKQEKDGSLADATTSIVGSGGEALKIETTALAVLAWLQNARYAGNVESGMKFLAETCKAGRFGSTQSTVLALRAIVAYDQARAKPKAPGYLQLIVDDQPMGAAVEFNGETQGAIELPDASALLKPGRHTVQLRMTEGSEMPYSVAVSYNTLQPNSSRECKLHLECSLRDKKLEEGAVTEANVVVINRTGEAVPSSVAIVGVPGGMEVRHDQLKELVKSQRIAAYEVLGREVVLYWRSLKPEQRVELPISLVAEIPGTYTGPASRAYLYYTDEHKEWVEPLAVEITPK